MPVGTELVYNDTPETSSSDYTLFYSEEYTEVTNEDEIPHGGTRIGYRFIDKSGKDTLVLAWDGESYGYLEIPGEGVWRSEDRHVIKYDLEDYRETAFISAYENMVDNRDFTLSEHYNGSEKAVYISIADGKNGFDVSWNSLASVQSDDYSYSDDIWASHPEDVRYVFLYENWKVPTEYIVVYSDGRREPHYDLKQKYTLYDLVTGESEEIEEDEVFSPIEFLEEYLEKKR